MSLAHVPVGRQLRERREPRERALRIVDYTPFPRSAPDRPRVAFTRDVSPSGMCIGVDAAEAPGTMLRATLRELDGSPARCDTWQVVWCEVTADGRFWLGLQLVAAGPDARKLD